MAARIDGDKGQGTSWRGGGEWTARSAIDIVIGTDKVGQPAREARSSRLSPTIRDRVRRALGRRDESAIRRTAATPGSSSGRRPAVAPEACNGSAGRQVLPVVTRSRAPSTVDRSPAVAVNSRRATPFSPASSSGSARRRCGTGRRASRRSSTSSSSSRSRCPRHRLRSTASGSGSTRSRRPGSSS